LEPPYEESVNTHNLVIVAVFVTHATGSIMLRWKLTILRKKQIVARNGPASSGPNKASARTRLELQA
jgi:hypothetical protein